jgi:UDP-N-acetylglucosamine transferase subunit ALG13
MLDAVCAIAHTLPQPVIVQYGHTPFDCRACQGHAFFDMPTFEGHIAKAELVILHGGAGSVINAIRAGQVPVIVPRRAEFAEHINDHQVEFARQLAQQERVVLVENLSELQYAMPRAKGLRNQRTKGDAIPPLVAAIKELLRSQATQDS